MGKLIFAILLLSATNVFAQSANPTITSIDMRSHQSKSVLFYEIIAKTDKGTFISTANDCTGVCREVCFKGETPVSDIPVPSELTSQYLTYDKKLGDLSSSNYCGEITLAQMKRLKNFGYDIDWEKIETKQKCCVKK